MTATGLEAPPMAPNSLVHVGAAAPVVAESTEEDRRPTVTGSTLVRRGIEALRHHYGDGLARLRLVATALTLIYVGGAAMFWLHAIHRGEAGPAIAHGWHWLLDSTIGLVGLGPVVLVLLPLARRLAGRRDRMEPVIVGGLFGLVTTPGPILHNLIAGQDTPLARMATSIVGHDPNVAASHADAVDHSLASEAFLQLAVGLPVYVLLVSALWWVLRRRTGSSSRVRQVVRRVIAKAGMATG